MNLIKEAQQLHQQVALMVESCSKYNIKPALLESLDGVLHTYIQGINSGKLTKLSYDNISELATIFAFANLIGAVDAPKVDTNGANAIINLYRRARPGNNDAVADQIDNVVDNLDPDLQGKFKQLANMWGKTLSVTIQNPSTEALQAVSNQLLQTVHKMQPVIQRLQSQHGDAILKKQTQSGILSRQLGLDAF